MAVFEKVLRGRYGLWIDGFEPSQSLLIYRARGSAFATYGIEGCVLSRHGLTDLAANAAMPKAELWPRLLGAHIEQELRNLQEDSGLVDVFLMKRGQTHGEMPPSLLCVGAMSGHASSHDIGVVRQNYTSLLARAPEYLAGDIRQSVGTALEHLCFRITPRTWYRDYDGFERQCQQFLSDAINAFGDDGEYRDLCRTTGLDTRRAL